jgi:hypothetical protein
MTEERSTCRCGAREGELHDFMCDWEPCPFCGHQLSTCDCVYDMLGLKNEKHGPETHYLPYDTFVRGLTDKQHETWFRLCEARGRVPYILWPNLCGRCGALWPEMFRVPDEAWEKYVEIRERHKMLCRSCYDTIKKWIDDVEKERVTNLKVDLEGT